MACVGTVEDGMVEDTLLSALLSVDEVSGDFTVIPSLDGLSQGFPPPLVILGSAGPKTNRISEIASAAHFVQSRHRVQLSFQVPLQRLHGKAPQIGGTVARPVFRSQDGDGSAEDTVGDHQRRR